MAKLMVLLLVLALALVAANAQNEPASNRKPFIGQTFDEIVVSSDLNVKRKSKENRQGKKLLTNVPSGTTGPPGRSTAIASRLISSDGSLVIPIKRERRAIAFSRKRFLNLGAAAHLLNS